MIGAEIIVEGPDVIPVRALDASVVDTYPDVPRTAVVDRWAIVYYYVDQRERSAPGTVRHEAFHRLVSPYADGG